MFTVNNNDKMKIAYFNSISKHFMFTVNIGGTNKALRATEFQNISCLRLINLKAISNSNFNKFQNISCLRLIFKCCWIYW